MVGDSMVKQCACESIGACSMKQWGGRDVRRLCVITERRIVMCQHDVAERWVGKEYSPAVRVLRASWLPPVVWF